MFNSETLVIYVLTYIFCSYQTTLDEACTELCNRWVEWPEGSECPFTKDDITKLNPLQVREFLAQLLEEKPFSVEKLKQMESVYGFNSVKNSEIQFRHVDSFFYPY